MSEPSTKSPWILDADEATFQQQAVERSREMLVVVDFWAAWCQPCRLLGPVLEKLAADGNGKFLLVKADVDQMPNIAAGFNVQSIPAVYAMRDGQLLDFFVGVRSEEQLRAWIDRLLPSAAETLVAEAKALASADPTTAEAKFREAMALDVNLATARIGLGELLLDLGRADEARGIVDELERRGFLEPEAERLKARLHLGAPQSGGADIAALKAAVAAAPGDLAAKIKLAEALAAQSQYEEALEIALTVVQAGKKEFVEPARQLMVDVFRLLPDDSELATTYRRRLSTALY